MNLRRRLAAGSIACGATEPQPPQRDSAKVLPDPLQCSRDSMSVWSEAMQPNSEAGELIPNGSPAGSSPDPTTGELNGGSSEIHELLQALQAVRVGDFSVRMAGNQV